MSFEHREYQAERASWKVSLARLCSRHGPPSGRADRNVAEPRVEAVDTICVPSAPTHSMLPLMKSLDEVLQVVQAFNDEGVDYVVVGGVAVNLHGLVRATEDLDVFVRPDADNIARLRRALRSVWDDPDIQKITAEDLCGDYPAVRYGPPSEAFYLDILTRLGEATRFSDLEVEEKKVGSVRVVLATPRTLYRMKKDTVRPIDHADAAALREAFDLEED